MVKGIDVVGPLLFIAVLAGIMGIAIGILAVLITNGCQYWCESQAIERGCAEWTVDPKTGETEWQWTCGSEPKGGE